MLLLVLWQRKPPKVNTFNRWLMIIFWPLLSLGGWIELMNAVAKTWPQMGILVASVFFTNRLSMVSAFYHRNSWGC